MKKSTFKKTTKKEAVCRLAVKILDKRGTMGLYDLARLLNEAEIFDFPVHVGYLCASLGMDCEERFELGTGSNPSVTLRHGDNNITYLKYRRHIAWGTRNNKVRYSLSRESKAAIVRKIAYEVLIHNPFDLIVFTQLFNQWNVGFGINAGLAYYALATDPEERFYLTTEACPMVGLKHRLANVVNA